MKYLKKFNKPKYYVIFIFLVIILVFSISSASRFKEATFNMSYITPSSSFDEYYSHVKEEWSISNVDNFYQEILVSGMVGNTVSGEDYGYSETLIHMIDGEVTQVNVDIAQSGVYQIALNQKDISSSILANSIGIKINGEYPYEEAKVIELMTIWSLSTNEFTRDRFGNEILPNSLKYDDFYTKNLYDSTALNSRPLQFYFESGSNNIEIILESGEFLLKSLVIESVEEIPTYEDYLILHEDKEMGSENIITIGAESFTSKTNPSTRLTSVNDPSATSYDSQYRMLNQ